MLAASVAHGQTVTKSPDLGTYWHPLSTQSQNGTEVYADSFVAPVSGTVTNIGLWLANYAGDTSAQPVVFEVLGTAAAGGPDTAQVLATTGTLTLDVTGPLSLYTANTTSSLNLVAGDTYWVAGDEVGLSGGGQMITGGHTQNSGGIVDNGTFWYSNDPTGVHFDGQSLTPEIAFQVTMANAVPEPAAWATMLLGLFGAGAMLRSRGRQREALA